jgi:hypothetical protein
MERGRSYGYGRAAVVEFSGYTRCMSAPNARIIRTLAVIAFVVSLPALFLAPSPYWQVALLVCVIATAVSMSVRSARVKP